MNEMTDINYISNKNNILDIYKNDEIENIFIQNKKLMVPKHILLKIPFFTGLIKNNFNSLILQINYKFLNSIFLYFILNNKEVFSSYYIYELIEIIELCNMLLINDEITSSIYNDIFIIIFEDIDIDKNTNYLLNLIIYMYNYKYTNIQQTKKRIINKCIKKIKNIKNYHKFIEIPDYIPYDIFLIFQNIWNIWLNKKNDNELINFFNNIDNSDVCREVFIILINRNFINLQYLTTNTNIFLKIYKMNLLFDYILSKQFNIYFYIRFLEEIKINTIIYNYLDYFVLTLLYGKINILQFKNDNFYNTSTFNEIDYLQYDNILERFFFLENKKNYNPITSNYLYKLNNNDKFDLIKQCSFLVSEELLLFYAKNNVINLDLIL